MEKESDTDELEAKPCTRTYAFEKELINNSNRQIRVSDHKYHQKCAEKPIAGKFWSKYDLDFPLDPVRYKWNFQLLSKHLNHGPRERYPAPILESHKYGWFHHQHQSVYDKDDRKSFYFGKDRDEITRFGERLLEPKIRPAFGGVPFKLQ